MIRDFVMSSVTVFTVMYYYAGAIKYVLIYFRFAFISNAEDIFS